jgi:hypothetical protein
MIHFEMPGWVLRHIRLQMKRKFKLPGVTTAAETIFSTRQTGQGRESFHAKRIAPNSIQTSVGNGSTLAAPMRG